MDATVVTLAIPARAEYLVLARLTLTGLARSGGINDDDLADLKLALTEAVANTVVHAYGTNGGSTRIRFELAADRIEIEVSDDGPGLVGGELPGDLWEPAESGMGLAIIRALADEVSLDPGAGDRGLRLRFAKQLGQ